ncbi:hypothetical protein McanCB49686_005323 [Microsporum canis]
MAYRGPEGRYADRGRPRYGERHPRSPSPPDSRQRYDSPGAAAEVTVEPEVEREAEVEVIAAVGAKVDAMPVLFATTGRRVERS